MLLKLAKLLNSSVKGVSRGMIGSAIGSMTGSVICKLSNIMKEIDTEPIISDFSSLAVEQISKAERCYHSSCNLPHGVPFYTDHLGAKHLRLLCPHVHPRNRSRLCQHCGQHIRLGNMERAWQGRARHVCHRLWICVRRHDWASVGRTGITIERR